MDWNLTILADPSSPGKNLWGLRRTIHFPSSTMYYIAIVLDLLLRYPPASVSFYLSDYLI